MVGIAHCFLRIALFALLLPLNGGTDNITTMIAPVPVPASSSSVQRYQLKSAEHLLYAQVFRPGRYRRSVRPVQNHEESVKVRVGMCIMTIDDIIEKDQSMVTSGCVKMKWVDEFLQWNPDEFQGLGWLALPSSDIWLPDIAMVNSPDPYYLTRKLAYAEISSNGEVGYYPSGRFSTRCHITLTYFPFDWQECDFRFESWVYPNTGLSIEPWYPEPIDIKDYYKNHQWDLTRYAISTGNVTYDGMDFSFILFRFYFRRKILYYCVLVIFPCTLMSLLQMLSHTLAVEHPARVTVLTSLFVSSTFLQGSLAAQMPKSSEGVTLIQIYLMIMSLNLILSLLVTFLNMHVWFRVPPWPFPTLPHMLHAYFLDIGTTPASHVNPPLLPAALIRAMTARREREELEKKAQEKRERKLERARQRRELRLALLQEQEMSENVRYRLNDPTPVDSLRDDSNLKLFQKKDVAVFINEQNPDSDQDKLVLTDDETKKPLLDKESPVSLNEGGKIQLGTDEEKAMLLKGASGRRSSSPALPIESNLRSRKSSAGGFRRKSRSRTSRQQLIEGESDVDDYLSSSNSSDEPEQEPALPPPPPPTLAERKERWLQFSRVLDKVLLCFMVACNLLSPVIIFGIIPIFQAYSYDYDLKNIDYFVDL